MLLLSLCCYSGSFRTAVLKVKPWVVTSKMLVLKEKKGKEWQMFISMFIPTFSASITQCYQELWRKDNKIYWWLLAQPTRCINMFIKLWAVLVYRNEIGRK